VSHAACELCAAGRFQNATRQSACHACGVSSTAAPARGFCECDAGHTAAHAGSARSAPECRPCAADTFKETLGQHDCAACGHFMRAPGASTLQTQCLYNAGYAFAGSYEACVACAGGTFKTTVNNGTCDCLACPAHTHSPAASTNRSACACNAGFTPRAAGAGEHVPVCETCAPGFFKAAPGTGSCEACAADTYNPHANATRCLACYSHSSAPASTTALVNCECDASRSVQGAACVACALGTFAVDQTVACETCANSRFTNASAQTVCQACAADAYSHAPRTWRASATRATRTLPPRRRGPGCARRVLPTRTRRRPAPRPAWPARRTRRPPAASVLQNACQCSEGFHQEGARQCRACAPGAYSDALDVEACTACADGRFANASSMTACHFCWSHSASDGALAGCECLPGFTPAGPTACVACAQDTYKETPDDSTCVACRAHSRAGAGSFLAAQCLCLPGFHLRGDAATGECVVCAAGTFKSVASNEACTV